MDQTELFNLLLGIIIIIIIIINNIYSFRVFHISVSWWSFTGVWVTASLQDSSHYSGLPKKFCRLDVLHSVTNFQLLQYL